MCSAPRTASHGRSEWCPPKTWDSLFTCSLAIHHHQPWPAVASRGQPWSATAVSPSHREAGSQCVLIIPWNLREAELVYLCTPGLGVDRPWGAGLLNICVPLELQKRHRGGQAGAGIPELSPGREAWRNLTQPHHWRLPSLAINLHEPKPAICRARDFPAVHPDT